MKNFLQSPIVQLTLVVLIILVIAMVDLSKGNNVSWAVHDIFVVIAIAVAPLLYNLTNIKKKKKE